MQARTVAIIMRKELRDAQRNRWIIWLAMIFTGLSLALSYLGLSGLGTFGVAGFGRTAASLVNLVVLLVPLMGLLIGAVSIAAEREHGTLLTLMAQPVTGADIVVGKFLGIAATLASAVGIGFGLSALVIARLSGWHQLGVYLALVGGTLLLGLAHLGIGLCLSVVARRSATALGGAIFLWLLIVCLSDLGLMGTAMVLKLTPSQLLWLSLGNPVQLFRLVTVQALQGNLELLGAPGLYAASIFGHTLIPLLSGLLACWVLATLALSLQLFHHRGGL